MKQDSSGTGALAIISPCSTCKNQLAEPKDGKPMCPRRYWEEQKKKAAERGNDEGQYEPLVAPGNDKGDGSLSNPVYWNDGKSIMVWVARLIDNQARIEDGQVVGQDILSQGFDTEYISCRPYPYSPEDDEATYFLKGALREGQRALITDVPFHQNWVEDFKGVPLGGTVKRTSILFDVPRTPVDDHISPEGM